MRFKALMLVALLGSGCGDGQATKHDNGVGAAPATHAAGGQDATVAARNGLFTVRAHWLEGPELTAQNALDLHFNGQDGKTRLRVDKLVLSTWRPELGSGAPAAAAVGGDADDGGGFHVNGLNLSDPGLWQLIVTAAVGGVTDSAVIEFRL